MDLGVRDRGYLIVGGTAGMGLAAAAVLAAEGALVAVAGRDAERAADAANGITRDTGGAVIPVVGDVSRGGEAERLVSEAADALGGLSGIAITTGTSRSAHCPPGEASDAVWADTFEEVLMGTVRSVRAAVPYLVTGGGGTVVTTAAYSIRSYQPSHTPYLTLKSGVAAFTKTIAREYGQDGVRANCVCPGAIETDGLAAMRAHLARERGVSPEGLLEQVMGEEWHMDVALGRPGRPSEVGELFAFLLSPRAGYLSGAVINMDGGTDF